jgi:hypothetical protein
VLTGLTQPGICSQPLTSSCTPLSFRQVLTLLLFPQFCKFPVMCKSRKMILDHHFPLILSTQKNYCMFCRVYTHRIIQKNKDQSKCVSTVRQKQQSGWYLPASAPRDPIDLVNLLIFWATRSLIHIIRTTCDNVDITDPMRLLCRQESYLGSD